MCVTPSTMQENHVRVALILQEETAVKRVARKMEIVLGGCGGREMEEMEITKSGGVGRG